MPISIYSDRLQEWFQTLLLQNLPVSTIRQLRKSTREAIHDLEKIIAQEIPILLIDQVIIDQVKATSAAELESNIQAIVKGELQSIVNLGGILGLVVGLLQTLLLFLQKA